MKKTFLAIMLMMVSVTAFSQLVVRTGKGYCHQVQATAPSEEKRYTVFARITGNDTLLIVNLPEVDIDLMNHYFQISETRRGRKLISNVRKVYPYAKLAGDKLREIDTILANVPSESERSRLVCQVEDELTEQYTEELKHLNFSQGLILIRLIDRETGNTSYKLVQELRGRVRAFFYQGFARLWGYNLKSQYDPKNNPEDDEIETIVTLLERGQI
ncbi:MAG: DUF4294 domain-containing protein [Bacteroidales bacterium]|nr:DUF4294 domain-containing protein [Bacteroidales bacterium]